MRTLALLCCVAVAATAAAQVTIYESDFEAGPDGWKATATWDPVGDWEHGKYDFNSYTGANNPPPKAYSGQSLWATVLHDDYTNSGGETFLTQTFDFTGYTDVEMTFAEWAEVFYTWDTAKLYANNTLVYDVGGYAIPTDWAVRTVDLSDFDGMADVELKFELHASTVVEKAGWYIDDVKITGVPEPASLLLLGLGALLRRR